MSDKDTLYSRWLTGDISPVEEQALKSSGEWKELQTIIDATQNLNLPHYNKDEAFKKLNEARAFKKKNIRSLSGYKWISIAASFLLAIGVFWWMQSEQNIINTNQAERKDFTFIDGSSVRLNAETKISYSESDWNSLRDINLDGEAIFKVNKGVPFSVTTPNGVVEVLGTEFNVKSRGNKLIVTCYSGKVKVSSNTSERIITQSQSVEIVDGILSEIRNVNEDGPDWTLGESRFKNESLNIVIEELERQFGVKVDISNTIKSFSGSFTHDNLTTALDQVFKPLGISYTIEGNTIVVIE